MIYILYIMYIKYKCINTYIMHIYIYIYIYIYEVISCQFHRNVCKDQMPKLKLPVLTLAVE